MKKRTTPPPAETSVPSSGSMVAINEALVLSSVRQHELTEEATVLNTRLEKEIIERKRVEASLRFSEVRYRRLFEAASDGLLLLDPLSGKITNANPCISLLSGHPQDQIIGRQLWEIGLFGSQKENRQMFGKLKKTLEIHYEQILLEHRDGNRLTVEVVANLYQESGHSVIQCHIRDITERKNAEIAQRRIDVLSASNAKLNREIVQRQAAEEALHQTQKEQLLLLVQAQRQEELLRDMSRRVLSSQEEERKRISRELHDVISQNLIGINLSMEELSTSDTAAFSDELQRKITDVQQIVETAVDSIHQFSRELRPTMLDDLGLIPALQVFLEQFMAETGIRSSLTASGGVEEWETEVLTALYRMSQEALANVAHHSHASKVAVRIMKADGILQMEIQDDGVGCKQAEMDITASSGRLGLLGMKERIEMAGGSFQIESHKGNGTTIRAVFSKPVN